MEMVLSIALFLGALGLVSSSPAEIHILSKNATGALSEKVFCVEYNSGLSVNLTPSDAVNLTWLDFVYADDLDLCSSGGIRSNVDYGGKMLAVMKRPCSSYQQLANSAGLKVAALVLVTSNMFHPGTGPRTNASIDAITLLVMPNSSLVEILNLPDVDRLKAQVYSLPEAMEWGGVLLLVLAVGILIIGTLRSGRQRFAQIEKAYLSRQFPVTGIPEKHQQKGGAHFGPAAVIILALMMTALLVLMYYFYQYMVYVIISLFVIGSTTGLFECLKFFVTVGDCNACKVPCAEGNAAKCFGSSVDIRKVILYFACLTFAVCWAVYRHESFSWILLDILGGFFLISIFSGIQMPSLKSCTIFLSLLFIYDIFFVFITPFLTKDGQSIMVQVATGGSYDPTQDSGSGGGEPREIIPAAFRMPRLHTRQPCDDLFNDNGFSLLGFGDVMVPGLLASFLRTYELVTKMSPIYSISCFMGYVVSLIVTNVALTLMRTGQPALLYIVPIMLAIVFGIAWRRREVSVLWKGNLLQVYQNVRMSAGDVVKDGTVETGLSESVLG